MAKDQSIDVPSDLRRGGYVARFARTDGDVAAAGALRHLCFIERAGLPARTNGLDSDHFDALCDHVLVENADGQVVCCFRVLSLRSGADIGMSYSAQYYDLEQLSGYSLPMVELGRFCVHPDAVDADVLRIAWGMLAAFVDMRGAAMLFGCASFEGTNAAPYAQAFDLLSARHLAPSRWRPAIKSTDVVDFGASAKPITDHRRAMGQIPSLLKTYLTMGGWVSDHAVIDRDMNTLHVFTGVEIATIPAARAQALRAI